MLSKSLTRRLQTLREQCRAFSSSSRAHAPDSSTPNAAFLSVLESGASRSSASPAAERPSHISRVDFLTSQLARSQQQRQSLAAGFRAYDFDNAQSRRWVPGDVVSPHDLSFRETEKWRFDPKKQPGRDVFDVLGVDPSNEWRNFAVLGEFMTDMGRIRHKRETGLRTKNQRKISKAIRRAIGSGLHPSVHRHPELLEQELYIQTRKDMQMRRR